MDIMSNNTWKVLKGFRDLYIDKAVKDGFRAKGGQEKLKRFGNQFGRRWMFCGASYGKTTHMAAYNYMMRILKAV